MNTYRRHTLQSCHMLVYNQYLYPLTISKHPEVSFSVDISQLEVRSAACNVPVRVHTSANVLPIILFSVIVLRASKYEFSMASSESYAYTTAFYDFSG